MVKDRLKVKENLKKEETAACRFKDIWKGKKILVADDESTCLYLIREILRKTQIEIINAMNGKEAVQACIENPDIALALIDYNMPEMDGEQTTEQIRAIRNNMPVIIHTGQYQYSVRKNCKNAGCNDIIYKPLRRLELLEKIENWINIK